jgi:N-acetylmuramoyl-L-alanine amidase
MKRITITALATALGIALFQPGFTFAQDKAQNDKGQGKQEKVQGKGNGNAGHQQVSKGSTAAGGASVSKSHPAVANVKPGKIAPDRSRGSQAKSSSTVRDRQQSRSSAVAGRSPAPPPQTLAQQKTDNRSVVRNSQTFNYQQYNRTNNYGGRWVQGGMHPGWDRNRIHDWDNHRYRWYDGGWLVIDGGFWPPDYYGEPAPYRYSYAHSDYTSNGTVAAVQRKLGDLGYYNGYADGIVGPITRNAIANYQRDYGLAVTGRINDALLSSLGVG